MRGGRADHAKRQPAHVNLALARRLCGGMIAPTMPKKAELATIRVVVKMTHADRDTLVAHCEDEVRSVGSWFRLQVRKAWKVRRPPKRTPGYQRNQGDGVERRLDVWARLTEEERDQLDVLAGDEAVSVSIWFRRRLAADIAAAGGARGFVKAR